MKRAFSNEGLSASATHQVMLGAARRGKNAGQIGRALAAAAAGNAVAFMCLDRETAERCFAMVDDVAGGLGLGIVAKHEATLQVDVAQGSVTFKVPAPL